jgi:hypothetical protein
MFRTASSGGSLARGARWTSSSAGSGPIGAFINRWRTRSCRGTIAQHGSGLAQGGIDGVSSIATGRVSWR